jgi:hypothetical protein
MSCKQTQVEAARGALAKKEGFGVEGKNNQKELTHDIPFQSPRRFETPRTRRFFIAT